MKKKIVLLCMGLCMLMTQIVLAAPAGHAAQKISYFATTVIPKTDQMPEVLRIEIGLSRASEAYEVHENVKNSNELIIELGQTKLSRVKRTVDLGGKLARQIEFTDAGQTNSRATITLPRALSKTNYQVYTLPRDKKAKKPFRIVIDIIAGAKVIAGPNLAGKVIVLDPGHGGSDPGAIGPNGVREKDVTLKVSRKVADLLRQSGAKVVMTRQGDRDVYGLNAADRNELQARVDIGRQHRADLFLSIHANSFTKPTAHGTATYYYAKTPRDGILAEALQKGMVEAGGLYDRGTLEANFYVVKRSAMPAALLEMAFISNPEEERLLDSEAFEQKLARGICAGIDAYFAKVKK